MPGKQRLALVTGGVRGIGKAIALALRKANYTVAVTCTKKIAEYEKFCEKNDMHLYAWDISDAEACDRHMKSIVKDHGKNVDVLVNNAGIIRDSMAHKMRLEDWDHVLRTNLDSCFYMCRAVLPEMREKKFGRIVNLSSINALAGQLGQANYSAAKAGMIGMSKALAQESASKNITVNIVAPGYIETDMTQSMPEKVKEEIIKSIPIGRLGYPEEIARAVLFLVADEAGFITGTTLSINGGQYMH